MKISDIISKAEYILSLVNEDLEFSSIVTDPINATSDSLLIIPNSEKIKDNFKLKEIPIATICNIII